MNNNRRQFLSSMVYGGGMLGLRALATGLPLQFFLDPARAVAATDAAACNAAPGQMGQFLLVSTTSKGCPINANAPGAYLDPTLVHSKDTAMRPVAFPLGSSNLMAATPWTILSARIRANLAVVHHATNEGGHQNLASVMSLRKSITGGYSLPAFIAQTLQPCLNTLTNLPVNMSDDDIYINGGQAAPRLNAMSLKAALAPNSDTIANLHGLRDSALDEIYAVIKQNGNPRQMNFLDTWAQSRQEARSLSDNALAALNKIQDNSPAGTANAAAAMFIMKISPVAVMANYFGNDNHGDSGYLKEEAQHISGFNNFNAIFNAFDAVGMGSAITFAHFNVFGRTFYQKRYYDGRDHNGNHSVGLLIGSRVQAGVYGGVVGGSALAMDSATGVAGNSGDIPKDDSLSAWGKTVADACGIAPSYYNSKITQGKLVAAAVKG